MTFKTRKDASMIRCPQCRSLCVIPIAYGKPGDDLLHAAERGLVELGGCVIDDESPRWRCLDCRHAWGCFDDELEEDEDEENAERLYQRLSRVRDIVERHLFSIYTGMVSSDLFGFWNRSSENPLEAAYAYVQLKKELGIEMGSSAETFDFVRSFMQREPEMYERIIKEARTQVCVQTLTGDASWGLHQCLFNACRLMTNELGGMVNGERTTDERLDDIFRTIRSGVDNIE